jgi:hypothetical protein
MPLMVHLHYNWPRERHSRPPHPPRGLSGGPLALTLARRGGKLPSVVLFPGAKKLITPERNLLGGNIIEALKCLRGW